MSYGTASILESPSLTFNSSCRQKTFFGSSRVLIPVPFNSCVNTRELPSPAGTSLPLISISILSIPSPAKAAITCSTLFTPTPFSPNDTIRLEPESASTFADTFGWLAMSVRMNFMPVFAGAGLKRSLTPLPVKSPTPEYSTILEIVLCWLFKFYFFAFSLEYSEFKCSITLAVMSTAFEWYNTVLIPILN